ncbi:MarR family transcriptional regulator [bacterium]|nr:MarR family transcriptional regulator [bacterium]
MEEEIISTIFKLDNMLRRMGNRIAGVLGATQQQWAVLDILNDSGSTGIPLSELGKNLDVTKGNITGLIDRMERDGLAKRKDDPKDRRVIRAVVTAKGKKVLRDIQPVKNQWGDRLFHGFNVKDKKELNNLLKRLMAQVTELEN